MLVDVSNPDFIAGWRDLKYVVEIFDHHSGALEYWKEQIGEKAHIEFIGAACTLVFEEIKRRGYAAKLSETSARLLYTGILSNTLNFRAELTSPRDHQAYAELAKPAHLPTEWAATYFGETETTIMSDVTRAVKDDTKELELPHFGFAAISQLELWDAKGLFTNHLDDIKHAHEGQDLPWFHTSPSINEGKNFLYCEDSQLKKLLAHATGAKFDGDLGYTSRLWLRKEILKALYSLPEKVDYRN